MKPARIVIFAKAPLAGFAKTRLIPALGAQGAADLARRMLVRTLAKALDAAVGPVELCVAPSAEAAIWRTLVVPDGVQWSNQGEGDLGERMARAARRALLADEPVLLIGTDCPDLGVADLREAAADLRRVDATLVPTLDGGYGLLGLKRFDPSLFSGIAWSTDTVAAETLARLQRLEWSVASRAKLRDIDEPADLAWLPDEWQRALRVSQRRTSVRSAPVATTNS